MLSPARLGGWEMQGLYGFMAHEGLIWENHRNLKGHLNHGIFQHAM